MSTRTTCRVGSDVDLLSRVQLEEVLKHLETNCPKGDVEFVSPGEIPQFKHSKTHPNSPARVALLMSALVEGNFDALVLDAAVLPLPLPSGITFGAITRRLTPCEALISGKEIILDELAENAVLAANGIRREAQMHYYRPDLRIVQAKGSVDSLIQKVNSARIDAAVVAAADMERLGKQEVVVELLTNSVCVPAAGQGALAVLVRAGEERFAECICHINDAAAFSEVGAERAFLEKLGVDGRQPVGVLASTEGSVMEVEGVLAFPDGREKIHFLVKGTPGQEQELGETLADEILKAGGREILQELHLL